MSKGKIRQNIENLVANARKRPPARSYTHQQQQQQQHSFAKFSDAKNEWLKMELNGNYEAYQRGLFAFNMIINLGRISKQANDIENAIRFSKGFPSLKTVSNASNVLFCSFWYRISAVFSLFFLITISSRHSIYSLRIKWWSRKWACERYCSECKLIRYAT